jgi:serine/threonine-protein kinase RsbW
VIFLRVPANLAYRDLVTRAATTVCKIATGREGGVDPIGAETISELVSAVGEAFNNAVLHAYAGEEGGTVTVAIDAQADVIEVTMSDEGASFDLDAVPVPDLAALPESGMGIYIIRSFVDEVSYTPGPPNVLRMRKRL